MPIIRAVDYDVPTEYLIFQGTASSSQRRYFSELMWADAHLFRSPPSVEVQRVYLELARRQG